MSKQLKLLSASAVDCKALIVTPEIREAARQRILQQPGWQKMADDGNPNLAEITAGLVLTVVIDALTACQPGATPT